MVHPEGSTSDLPSSFPKTIIIKFSEHVTIPHEDHLEKKLEDIGLPDLKKLFDEYPGTVLNRVFTTLSPVEIEKLEKRAYELNKNCKPANFLKYYKITLTKDTDPDHLVEKLKSISSIIVAYAEGGPTIPPVVDASNDPRAVDQGYLNSSPDGIDARYIWTKTGGDGTGIQFVDLERGWILNHEDLMSKNITLISGQNKDFFGHGTAVLGEVVGVDNNIGGVGISPNVSSARVVSQWRTSTNYDTSDAIVNASNLLNSGDVLLLEAQTSANGAYHPVEVEPLVFNAIQTATALGIIVIESAGNGSVDLDNFTDVGGNNILNRSDPNFQDSGAIMVGAASSITPHTRLNFSNFGSRIDCYAWGQNIDTTGDGWTGNQTNTYTQTFGGTSGASPIITGAALCLQGIKLSKENIRFSPNEMRNILSNSATGTASSDPVNEKIGIMPDLRAIYRAEFGRCFIATAAYGTELEPPVQFLREFRDDVVFKSRFENFFERILEIYYLFSPPIANSMRQHKKFKIIMKYSIVLPFVALARVSAFILDKIPK